MSPAGNKLVRGHQVSHSPNRRIIMMLKSVARLVLKPISLEPGEALLGTTLDDKRVTLQHPGGVDNALNDHPVV